MSAFTSIPLLAATGGDLALCESLLAGLRASAAARVETLRRGVDPARWRLELHALRGAAASFGATSLAAAASAAEASDGDTALLDAIAAEIARLPVDLQQPALDPA